MSLKISVCIPSIRSSTLHQAVESIIRQTWTNWELIIVGQGEDASLKFLGAELTKRDPRIIYIHLDRKGLSIARNAGIAVATGDVVAFTDDDCEAKEDWLETIAHCLLTEPDVDVISGSLLRPAKKSISPFATCPKCFIGESLYNPVADNYTPSNSWDMVGANVAIRIETLKEIGEFDENLGAGTFYPAGEDTDYKLRLEAAGIKMRSTPRSEVVHTYGYRYGLKSYLHHSKGYAFGNGALAAKLTLSGDKRGLEWLETAKLNYQINWLKKLKPYRIPLLFWYYINFKKGYEDCLMRCEVDKARHVLRKKGEFSSTVLVHS